MNCRSHPRKSELTSPTSSLPAARVGPSEEPDTPDISGWQLSAHSRARESRDGGHMEASVSTQMGSEVLITSPKSKTKTHSVRGSQLWLPVVGLECVPPAPYACVLQSPNVMRRSLQFSGLTVQVGQPDGGVMLVLTNHLKNPAGLVKEESEA